MWELVSWWESLFYLSFFPPNLIHNIFSVAFHASDTYSFPLFLMSPSLLPFHSFPKYWYTTFSLFIPLTPLTPALRRQTQVDLFQFQASEGYTVRPYLKRSMKPSWLDWKSRSNYVLSPRNANNQERYPKLRVHVRNKPSRQKEAAKELAQRFSCLKE